MRNDNAAKEGPSYSISISRPHFKFACAHMTVFSENRKERLHGHNFTLALDIALRSVTFKDIIDFAKIKSEMAALCAEWKERTLLPGENPYFIESKTNSGGGFAFSLCGENYSLPIEDVLVLPIDNVTVEALANHACSLLRDRLRPILAEVAISIAVRVEESPGQGARVCLPL